MKKILSFSLALSLLAFATSAHSTIFSASGYALTTAQFAHQLDLTKSGSKKDSLKVYERIELALDLLSPTEIGNIGGQLKLRLFDAEGGQFGSDIKSNYGVIPEVRSAYTFFPLASTPITVKLGLQEYALPGYLGTSTNPAFDHIGAGIVLNGSLGMLSPTFAWFVLDYPDGGHAADDVSNFYSLSVPLSFSQVFIINPWFAQIEDDIDSMYVGLTTQLNIKNFTTGIDLLYAHQDSNSSSLIDFYARLEFSKITPSLALWYSTGANGSNKGMTFKSSTASWGGFHGSNNLMFDNGNGLQKVFYNTTNTSTGATSNSLATPYGTLGIGLALADIALTKKTALSINALYIAETNKDQKQDAALEAGVSLLYSMADPLDFNIDANYYIPMSENNTTEANGLSFAISAKYSF